MGTDVQYLIELDDPMKAKELQRKLKAFPISLFVRRYSLETEPKTWLVVHSMLRYAEVTSGAGENSRYGYIWEELKSILAETRGLNLFYGNDYLEHPWEDSSPQEIKKILTYYAVVDKKFLETLLELVVKSEGL